MFDLARFRRLAAATWIENRRTWAWFFVVGIIVHVLYAIVFVAVKDGYKSFNFEGQAATWLFGLYLTGTIFSARYFQAMARRESAIVLLMTPASAFEKWLLAAIVIVVAYPIAYHIAFQVAGFPSWAYGKARAAAGLGEMLAHIKPSLHDGRREEFDLAWRYFMPWRMPDPRGWLMLLPMLVALQGFALLGSLYFRALPFIKTVVVGFGVLLVLILATASFEGDPSLFFGYWDGEMRLARWQAVVLPVAWFGVPALLWLACFVALREREVA